MVPFHFKQRSELKSDFYLVRTAAMMVSHDFAMRMVGNLIPQIPGSKEEVYDTTLESIVRKIGAHQVFMDISRCGKLTTLKFGCLQLCKSLSYLDVSYTKINDLRTISDNCVSLRGLNVAGTTLMDGNYSIVANLVSLEVLTLRNSNVNDVSWVHLLPMLRSLDLGILQVHTDPIAEIRNLTRLEELLLDCSTFPVCQEPSKLSTHLFEPFRHLPNLRLINLSETELSGHADNIRQCMTHHVYVEPMARRYISPYLSQIHAFYLLLKWCHKYLHSLQRIALQSRCGEQLSRRATNGDVRVRHRLSCHPSGRADASQAVAQSLYHFQAPRTVLHGQQRGIEAPTLRPALGRALQRL